MLALASAHDGSSYLVLDAASAERLHRVDRPQGKTQETLSLRTVPFYCQMLWIFQSRKERWGDQMSFAGNVSLLAAAETCALR